MDKLEKFSRIFKITLLRWLFSKMVSNLWFLKNLQGIFHIKLKAIFFNGISFENWRRFQKKFKGISFVKMKKFFIHTRASLARAVLSRVLSHPRYRPLLSVLRFINLVSVPFPKEFPFKINLWKWPNLVSVPFLKEFPFKIACF